MKAFKCDKCQEYVEFESRGEIPTMSGLLCPYELSAENTHLCNCCTRELRKLITEWWGFQVHDELLLVASNESQLIVSNSDDRDNDDDHTSVWSGAGPDCITGRLEAA